MAKSTDVTTRAISRNELADLQSFDEAVNLVQKVVGSIYNAGDVLGDGFVVANKDALIDVKFLILSYTFSQGDYGPMVVARIMTERNEKLVLVDGSSGIYDQMRQAEEKGFTSGLLVSGLNKSSYTYEDDNGDQKPAHTFYLNV